MKEFKIKIPTMPEFKRWWEIVKFKFNGGFVCSECKTRMFFDQVHIETNVNGKKFMFNDNSYKQPIRCPKCIQKEIDENQKWIFTEKHICDWCDTNKPTVTFFNCHNHKHIKTNFTFGSSWWNGHYICYDCLQCGLDDGLKNMKSSVFAFDKQNLKLSSQNRLGMLKK